MVFGFTFVSSLSLMMATQADAREFFGIRLGFPELGVQLRQHQRLRAQRRYAA
jgi:hypothetical protein